RRGGRRPAGAPHPAVRDPRLAPARPHRRGAAVPGRARRGDRAARPPVDTVLAARAVRGGRRQRRRERRVPAGPAHRAGARARATLAARPEGGGRRCVARPRELRPPIEPGARTPGLAAPHAVAWWWPT